jgi:hypothetical protein
VQALVDGDHWPNGTGDAAEETSEDYKDVQSGESHELARSVGLELGLVLVQPPADEEGGEVVRPRDSWAREAAVRDWHGSLCAERADGCDQGTDQADEIAEKGDGLNDGHGPVRQKAGKEM